MAKQENQTTRASLRLKGKALFRVKTARLSPREGIAALLKKEFCSLGFYRVLQLGRRASQKKELSQARDCSKQNIQGGGRFWH